MTFQLRVHISHVSNLIKTNNGSVITWQVTYVSYIVNDKFLVKFKNVKKR